MAASDPEDLDGWAGKSCHVFDVTLSTWLGGNNERVPVRIHWLLFVVPLFAIFGVLAEGAGPGGWLLALLTAGPLLFATVLVHEMGHLIAGSRCGATPIKILLWPLGGLAVSANAAPDARSRIFISAMGPATHLPMCAFWLGLTFAAEQGATLAWAVSIDQEGVSWFAALFATMVWMNIGLFVFNALIPCFPLDCSSIVVNTMILRGVKDLTSIATCIIVSSSVFIVVFLASGLYSFITDGQGVLSIFLALWLAFQTYQLYRASKDGRLAQHALFAAAAAAGAKQQPQGAEAAAYGKQQSDPYLAGLPPAPQICAGALVVLAIVVCNVRAYTAASASIRGSGLLSP